LALHVMRSEHMA